MTYLEYKIRYWIEEQFKRTARWLKLWKTAVQIAHVVEYSNASWVVIRKYTDGKFEIQEQASLFIDRNIKLKSTDEQQGQDDDS